MSETITNRGKLTYRTKCLEQARAEAFRACLAANPTFAHVEIVESGRAKGERRFVVEFLPSSPERIGEMVTRQQDARQQRAEGEGRSYLFVADRDRSFTWCHNPKSGETYEVTDRTCSCPDFTYRCGANGMSCKHQLALALAVAASDIEEFDAVEVAA